MTRRSCLESRRWGVVLLGYALGFGLLAGAPADEQWDPRFASTNGVSGWVQAIAYAEPNLYVAGGFLTAGGMAATNIARWDGTHWFALGPGWAQSIQAIATSGSNVYIGSSFLVSDGVYSANIAQWDGDRWTILGAPFNGSVYALATIGSDLFAAGFFTATGEMPVAHIAKWNGHAWEALGPGVNGPVKMMAVLGRDLYVGGQFTQAGSAAATNVARWDGSQWSALGEGAHAPLAMTVSAGQLWVMDTLRASYFLDGQLRRWDETSWSNITTQRFKISGDVFATIHGLAGLGGKIYVAGEFDNLALNPPSRLANSVAQYDGTNWSAAGSGFRYGSMAIVYQLVSSPSKIYACGFFDRASGKSAHSVAEWDGQSWSGIGAGSDPPLGIGDLIINGTNLYASGTFESPYNIGEGGLVRWDGAHWTLQSGLRSTSTYPPTLTCLAASGDFIYAGLAGNELLRYDGKSWMSIGTAVNSLSAYPHIFAMAASGTNVFVGGTFKAMSGLSANCIARWDGAHWSALRTGLSRGLDVPSVRVLAADGETVCAAGAFTSADGVAVNGLAYWDGAHWFALGGGVDGTIQAMRFRNGHLYVGGSFSRAGGVPVTNLAKWDGQSWSSVAEGLDGAVSDFVFNGNDLYVAGSFTSASGIQVNRIAKWDGTSWHALGSGVDNSVNKLACDGSDLFLSGAFASAGGKPSLGFAIWHIPPSLIIGSDGTRAVLSWPGTDPNYILEFSPQLTGLDWNPALPAPALVNGQWVVTNQVDRASRFFRLRKN